ncbi:lipopolysaccharide biosynthesis protein [Tepidamorphus sp. 3E244]|uniref:lipopolysaccharide biosynthesis protein n=1 Tax=Tepidamorphus sp. 3E244 TaxID=3385498 RepID=UPI0038FD2E0C
MIRKLLTGSAALFAIRLSGAGIGFLTQVLLARLLGSHELGVFYSATSLAAVAGFVMSQGYSQIAYRFSARYRDASKSALFKAFVSRALYDALWTSTAAAIIVALVSFLAPGMDASERIVWALSGALIVPSALMVVYTNLAGAIRMFGLCYAPEGIGKPVLFMALVIGVWAFDSEPTGADVMLMFAITVTVVTGFIVWVLRKHLPAVAKPSSKAEGRLAKRWRAEARPLVLLSLYTNSFADVAILFATPFLSQSDLAVFGVCLKLSLLIGYFVQITQQMAIPDLADAREHRDLAGMRRASKRAVVLPLALTVAAMLGCIVLGEQILAVFGPEFATARNVLLIMVASQIARSLAGPSAHMLTLSGRQVLNASLCVGALVALAIANAVFDPVYGPTGAAWAVVISYVGWTIATVVTLDRIGEVRTDFVALLMDSNRPARPIPGE